VGRGFESRLRLRFAAGLLEHEDPMSEHTDATEDRPDDDDVDLARDDGDELGGDDDDKEPQPWAKALPGDGDGPG
jgi:hypothetical protein